MATGKRSETVCVLGGTGFVGRSLCAQLVGAGFAVRVPTRNRQRNRNLLVLPGIDLRPADIHDPRALEYLFDGVSAVINLVGILNERGHDGSGFRHAHVELAEKIVEACQDTQVGRLIQMSALKANADRGPSHYLRTKGQAEQIIKDHCGEQIKYTIFRPSVIFGPEDSFINRFAGILKLSPVLPLAQLDARFAPVYVGDVAAALLRAAVDSRTQGKTFELCGPDVYTLGEILRFIRRELGVRRGIIGLPMPLGRLQAWIADYLIPGKPFSLDNMRSLTVASVCNEDGFASLGIKPKRMQTVVRQYLGPEPGLLAELRHSTGR
jgi:NADH dehydrogenase